MHLHRRWLTTTMAYGSSGRCRKNPSSWSRTTKSAVGYCIWGAGRLPLPNLRSQSRNRGSLSVELHSPFILLHTGYPYPPDLSRTWALLELCGWWQWLCCACSAVVSGCVRAAWRWCWVDWAREPEKEMGQGQVDGSHSIIYSYSLSFVLSESHYYLITIITRVSTPKL